MARIEMRDIAIRRGNLCGVHRLAMAMADREFLVLRGPPEVCHLFELAKDERMTR